MIDVGGGTGAVATAIAPGCGRWVVLEPEGRKLASGRQRYPEVEFVGGVAERIPFAAGSFDRAVALLAVHHFQDQGAALGEIRRVLRPGGRIVVEEMRSGTALAAFLRVFGRHGHEDGHGRERMRDANHGGPGLTGCRAPHGLPEPGDLRRMLEDHGFEEVHVQLSARTYYVAAVRGP